MRKILTFLVLLVLVMGVLPASAASTADLTSLAKYYPNNTAFFMALRSDDATIQTVDSVLQKVIAKLPANTVPPVSLKTLLDLGAQDAVHQDFASGFRSWLGDSVAIGVPSAQKMNAEGYAGLFALAVTNRSAAESAVNTLLTTRGGGVPFQKTTQNGFTVFTMTGVADMVFAVNDEVLLYGYTAESLSLESGGADLKDDPLFNDTLAMLPNGDYMAALYINTAEILKTFAPALGQITPGMDPSALANLAGAQAAGLTLLDDRSVALDMVVNIGNTTTLQKLGLNLETGGAVDPAFNSFIPADSSLVFHATNFKALYDNTLQMAHFAVKSQPGAVDQIDTGLTQIKGLFQVATGLDVDNGILSWLTGDYALFAHLDVPAFAQATVSAIVNNKPVAMDANMFGFGGVVRAADPAKAKAAAAALGKLLELAARRSRNIKLSQDHIGGVDVTVATIRAQTGSDTSLSFDLVIGANDQVLVIATRPQATAILTGTPGLDTAPGYIEASKYLVGNPSSIFYMDANGFAGLTAIPLLALIPAQGEVFSNPLPAANETPVPTLTAQEQQQRQQERLQREADATQTIFNTALGIITSSSMSATTTENGDTVMRVVLTLAP